MHDHAWVPSWISHIPGFSGEWVYQNSFLVPVNYCSILLAYTSRKHTSQPHRVTCASTTDIARQLVYIEWPTTSRCIAVYAEAVNLSIIIEPSYTAN